MKPANQPHPLQNLINAENADGERDTAIWIANDTESRNADVEPISGIAQDFNSTAGSIFVELGEEPVYNSPPSGVSAIQQQFNSNSTVELESPLKEGDRVEILQKGQFFRKRVTVQGRDPDGAIVVKGHRWLVTQRYPAHELRLLPKEGV
jgi:hypothetical protein